MKNKDKKVHFFPGLFLALLLSLSLCGCSNTSTSTNTIETTPSSKEIQTESESQESTTEKTESEENSDQQTEEMEMDMEPSQGAASQSAVSKSNDQLNAMLEQIEDQIPFQPELGIVLGSGLGEYADSLEVEAVIPYEEIDGFPVSTVEGHEGQFVFARIDGVPVVLMDGRVHLYEGYSAKEVVLPIRLMAKMGISDLLLTNAAGGMAEDLNPGDLMIITDQIATAVENPLIGPNEEELGVRFPDMSEVYNKELIDLIRSASEKSGVPVKEGIYVQLSGPSYETPAEINMYKNFGDAIGMSTAIEAIAARHMGVNVAGISCITNKAAGLSESPLDHEEVVETGKKVSADFEKLVGQFIADYKFFKAAS